LPASPWSSQSSPERVSLGRRLFFDTRLSADGTISCAHCHQPQRAFTDGLPVARGIKDQLGTRNTPSLWNVAFATSEFWDGRRLTLEQQAADPFTNSREHGLRNRDALLGLIRNDPQYRQAFERAFSLTVSKISVETVASALAAFERTLLSGDSPFDRYLYGNDPSAMSRSAIRGLELFRGRAQCATCHTIGEKFALLTDNTFHNEGVGLTNLLPRLSEIATRVYNTPSDRLDQLIADDRTVAALGRFVVTKQPKDVGEFKTPSLRNVALTAPYMHDGSIATLAEAVDFEVYYRGTQMNAPLILTPQERRDLLEFLKSLTSPTALTFQ
jgi:cytochrome c peroxidase